MGDHKDTQHLQRQRSKMGDKILREVVLAAFEEAHQPAFLSAAADQLAEAKPRWQAGAPGGILPFCPYDVLGNPYAAPVTLGLVYPVAGQDPAKHWRDLSIPTVNLLTRSGLFDMLPSAKVLPIDYHCHQHTSRSLDVGRPVPERNTWPGDTSEQIVWLAEQAFDIDEWRCRNLVNSVVLFLGQFHPNRKVELERRLQPRVQTVTFSCPTGFLHDKNPDRVAASILVSVDLWHISAEQTTTGKPHRAVVDASYHPSAFLYAIPGGVKTSVATIVDVAVKLDWWCGTLRSTYTEATACTLPPNECLAFRKVASLQFVDSPAEHEQSAEAYKRLVVLSKLWKETGEASGTSQREFILDFGSAKVQEYAAALLVRTASCDPTIFRHTPKPAEGLVMDLALWTRHNLTLASKNEIKWPLKVTNKSALCMEDPSGAPILGGVMVGCKDRERDDHDNVPVPLFNRTHLNHSNLAVESPQGCPLLDTPTSHVQLIGGHTGTTTTIQQVVSLVRQSNVAIETTAGAPLLWTAGKPTNNVAATLETEGGTVGLSATGHVCKFETSSGEACGRGLPSATTLYEHFTSTHTLKRQDTGMKNKSNRAVWEVKCPWKGCSYKSKDSTALRIVETHIRGRHINGFTWKCPTPGCLAVGKLPFDHTCSQFQPQR